MSLATRLAKLSRSNKEVICQEWYNNLLLLEDKEELIKMYLKGIDYCLSNDFPSNDFIRLNFADRIEKHGIFLDSKIDSANLGKIVLLGSCFGSFAVSGYNTAEVFIKHKSNLLIMAQGNSFVMVDIFDDAIVQVFAGDEAKVIINRYGEAKVTPPQIFNNAIVKVKDKSKKTY